MYRIYCDGQPVWIPAAMDPAYTVLSPMLRMEIDKAASLTFSVPPANAAYDQIHLMTSTVVAYDGDDVVFVGRPTSVQRDWWGSKAVICEDALAWLNDAVLAPFDFTGSYDAFWEMMSAQYNAQVADNRKIKLANLGRMMDVHVVSEKYATALDVIRDCYMTIHAADHMFLQYDLTADPPVTLHVTPIALFLGQTIEFGRNLLDISEKLDGTKIYTGILPLGKTVNDNPVTIESVNGGSTILYDAAGVSAWGKIVKTITFSDIETPAALLEQARTSLADGITAAMTLDVTGIDLNLLGVNAATIRVGRLNRILSRPHGIDQWYRCNRVDLDMENPEKTRFKYGVTEKTLTEQMGGYHG